MSRRRQRHGGRYTAPFGRVVGSTWLDDDQVAQRIAECDCLVVAVRLGDVNVFTHLHEHGCPALAWWRTRGRERRSGGDS